MWKTCRIFLGLHEIPKERILFGVIYSKIILSFTISVSLTYLELKIQVKAGIPKTMPKYFLNNAVNYFGKVQSTTCQLEQIFNLQDFHGHYSTFRAEKKSWIFNTDKNAWKAPKQHNYDSKKVQKTMFLSTKRVKIARMSKNVYRKFYFSGSFINIPSWKHNQT